ncbi:hypothetical protein RND81_12G206100 [Saponaria officinalis]|uniref:Uncharacterized protein n=1 Tax=Saponaria officinalis TaxID=3572 RepID=A0AAW1HD64_SAPOF
MTKRNKKTKDKSGKSAMDTSEVTVSDLPQAMDTSESTAGGNSLNRKVKKGVQMKRTKNVRKMKAIAKAISKTEKASEKVVKLETKKIRCQSAKSLYD